MEGLGATLGTFSSRPVSMAHNPETTMRPTVVLVLAALGTGAFVAQRAAEACGMRLDPPIHRPEAIARIGDRLLQAGEEESAAGEIKGSSDGSYSVVYQRILADAVVRTEGRVTPEDGESPEAALTWAVSALEGIAEGERKHRRSAHPRTLTAVALGLTQIEGRRQEGYALLNQLAADDLLTSPQAYARLARLRRAAGELRRAAEAHARCRLMSKDPDETCGSSDYNAS